MIILIMAGILIGYSMFIRYTNVILVVPALIAHELYTSRTIFLKEKRRWSLYIILIVFVGGVLLYNWKYFGGVFSTIYSSSELGAYPWPYFSIRYALGPSPIDGFSLREAMLTLWGDFYILLLLIPFGWAYMKCPNAIVSAGIVLTTLILYSVYAFAPRGGNARFLLPMFPFLTTAIVYDGTMLG